jgi:hypothetical protein
MGELQWANRIRLVLWRKQKRISGPHLAAIHGTLIPVTWGRFSAGVTVMLVMFGEAFIARSTEPAGGMACVSMAYTCTTS